MKLRQPWLIRLVAFLVYWLLRIWVSTLSYRICMPDGTRHPADARRERYLYNFWHEALIASTCFRSRICILISQHADGELIARVCRHLGYAVARGSSTRGGGRALLDLVRRSRQSHLGVTPDGPRGPRRQVQPGLSFLASSTGLPIVACGFGFQWAWRARSWDQLALPVPFSTVTCVIAPALNVPPKLDRAGLERYRLLAEEQLLLATYAAERWAETGRKPNLATWAQSDTSFRQSA